MKNDDNAKKAGSPIFILIMFVAIIGFVIYIPEIYQKYNTQIARIFGIGSENENRHVDDVPEEGATSDYYQLGSNGTLKYKEITLSKIELNDRELSFTISADKIVDLSELDYYIEFYQERTKFIGRRLLTGTVSSSQKYSFDLSDMDITTTTYMIISHISDESIPKSERLKTDESGLGGFICTSGDYSYDYIFHQEKLVKVTKKYTYTNDDLSEYSKELFNYQKLINEYNELSGVTASIAESNHTFIYTLELDYDSVPSIRIDEAYKFNKDMDANVVKFKMEAEGFDCE